jgi:hypothetical protein
MESQMKAKIAHNHALASCDRWEKAGTDISDVSDSQTVMEL